MRGDDHVLGELGRWSGMSGKSWEQIAENLCVSERTLARIRKEPGRLTLYQLRQIATLAKTTDEELIRMIRG